jgi:hypothetical protein
MIDASTGRQYLSVGSMMIPISSLPHPLAHMYPGSYVLPDGRLKVDPKVYKAVEEQQKYNAAVGELARKQFKPPTKIKDGIFSEIYNKEAFPEKPKAEISRLSKKELEIVEKSNDKELKKMTQEGIDAEKKGDYKTEAIKHRQVQEKIRRQMIYNHISYYPDQESRKAFAYNSIQAHHGDDIERIIALGYLPDDVFFHDKISNQYYIKPEFVDEFKTKGIVSEESDLLYCNYDLYKKHNRHNKHSILPAKSSIV